MNPNNQEQPVQNAQILPGMAPGKPRIPNLRVTHQITPEMERKHQESKAKYPMLSLSAGEYVVEMVPRHPIGLFSIWAITSLLAILLLAALSIYGVMHDSIASTLMIPAQNLPSAAIMVIPVLILVAFFVLGGFIGTYIYEGNKFYLTNESVIQFIQTGIFTTKQQTVNLINVEDASAEQNGPLEQILNFGTIKLSTQGEETTYHFQFVANPKRVVNLINDTVEKAVRYLEGFPPTEF